MKGLKTFHCSLIGSHLAVLETKDEWWCLWQWVQEAFQPFYQKYILSLRRDYDDVGITTTGSSFRLSDLNLCSHIQSETTVYFQFPTKTSGLERLDPFIIY